MREKPTPTPTTTRTAARPKPQAVKPSAVKPTPTRTSPTTRSPPTSAARATSNAGSNRVRSAPTKASPREKQPRSNDKPPTATASPPASRTPPPTPPRSAPVELGPPPALSSSTQSLRRSISSVTTDADEVRRLRAQLQSMRTQVQFLHSMMQGLTKPEKQELHRLSFDGISPVKKTRNSVEVVVLPDVNNPFRDAWQSPTAHDSSASKERDLARQLDALQRQYSTLQTQSQEQARAFDASKASYEAQLEDYAAKLAVIDAENLQLHAHVEEYEEENLRLHAALAEMANEQDLSNMPSNNEDQEDDLADELGIDGLGDEPETDIHERCDAKIHELWQTIKTLKAYVETFRVENEDLRVQRDQAIASAERAWQENSKLAGNNNPQQKIKYVEVLKQENAELIQKVRELQSKLTKKQFKRGDAKDSNSGSEPLEEYPSMESGDDHSDDGSYEERTKLLKKMWARNKKLEEEIDRLQKEKQALVTRQSRSPSVDSRQSRQSSSTRSTARTATHSTTSSRWKK